MNRNNFIRFGFGIIFTIISLVITASVYSAFVTPSSNCYNCHRTRYEGTATPNHVSNNFPKTCESCHRAVTGSWRPASAFNHASVTSGCYDCHKARYDSTTNPNHVVNNFPTACEQCHKSTNSWKPASFNHASITSGCYECHKAKYDSTTNPKHSTIGLGTTCEQCHNISGWKPVKWNHSNPPASWTLTGSHTTLICTSCHTNSQQITGRECYSCHKTKYDSTTSPKHSTIGLGTTCEQCHTTSGWKPANWNHSNPPANWTLTGSHTTLTCTSCHTNSQQITGRECYSCHKARYDATTSPNHAASGFPTTCEQCHNTTAWQPSTWKHTNFPLTGLHTTVVCSKCHLNNQYIGTPKDCYSCHWTRNQRDPWKLRLGQTCEQCHNTSGWKPANWSHSSPPANWALTGLHNTVVCTTCHVNYEKVAGKTCYACHKARYDATTSPNHASSGFPTTCEQCHNTTAWKPSTWKHTNFPLTGLHTIVVCSKCHLNNQYIGTPKDCYSCHWTRNQRDPWKLRLGQTCEQCHNTSGWKPANWSHSSPPANWSLTGKHSTTVCTTCHVNYEKVAGKTCYACHKARYDASTNPKHSAAKISTVCENCHNTSAWTPGKFDHATNAKGAISPKMANNKCSDCHPNNNDYTRNATKCLGCHKREHNNDPCAQCHYTVAPWDKTR